MVRSQLFNREEEPTFDEAVTKLIQEESRIQALKGTVEDNAYITTGPRYPGPAQASQGSYPRKGDSEKLNKDGLVCNYCKKTGHTKDKCYQLHGRPPYYPKVHVAQAPQQGGAHATQAPQQGGTQLTQASQQGGAPNLEGLPSAQEFKQIMQDLQNLKAIMSSSSTIIGSTSIANSGNTKFFSNLSTFTQDFTNA